MSIPITYQDISNYIISRQGFDPLELRRLTFKEIENITGNPLVCYVTKTANVIPGSAVSIDEDDINGFSDLVRTTPSDNLDVFVISNGGSPTAAERIVRLLHEKYKRLRFFVAGNAYSAATIMCFSANEIIMHSQGTLGPIDPQINGIPAYAILKSFEEVEEKLKKEGPASLTAYMPLIAKYDLHLFNICRNSQQLSEELAKQYLKEYMFLGNEKTDDEIAGIVGFFMDHGLHKSHGRSIDRNTAKSKGLKIIYSEENRELDPLLLSLFNQYQFFFGQSPFYKLFENAREINWGKANQQIPIPVQAIPNQQMFQINPS